MLSLFLAYAPSDAALAEELRTFLGAGCDEICFAGDSTIAPGRDLISTAETGHSADILIVLMSPASSPARWVRERWEPVLRDDPSEGATRIAIFLLAECVFPPLLRRGSNFFDATGARLPAMRQLKRWLRGIQSGTPPGMSFAQDLEDLYRALADKPGMCTATGAMADRFAKQAARDFEAVFRITAQGRSLTRIAGELGAQLGM